MTKHARTGALMISLFFIGLLVFSGPAQAVTLSLSADDDFVARGEALLFTPTLTFASSDVGADVETITLNLSGPRDLTCSFTLSGEQLSACRGIDSISVQSADAHYQYGYGYGYGYHTITQEGDITYNIVFDTYLYERGLYTSTLEVELANTTYEVEGPEFEIYGVGNFGGFNDDVEEADVQTLSYQDVILPVSSQETIPYQYGSVTGNLAVGQVNGHVPVNISGQPYLFTLGSLQMLDLDRNGTPETLARVGFLGGEHATLIFSPENTLTFSKESTNLAHTGLVTLSAESAPSRALQTQGFSLPVVQPTYTLGNDIFLIIILVFLNLVMIELIAIRRVRLRR